MYPGVTAPEKAEKVKIEGKKKGEKNPSRGSAGSRWCYELISSTKRFGSVVLPLKTALMEKFCNSCTFATLLLKVLRWLGPTKPMGFYSPLMQAPAGPGAGPRTPAQYNRVTGVHELLVPQLSLQSWLRSSQKNKHEVAGQAQTPMLQTWHATATPYSALLLILRAKNSTWELPVLLPWTSPGKFEDFWQQIEGSKSFSSGLGTGQLYRRCSNRRESPDSVSPKASPAYPVPFQGAGLRISAAVLLDLKFSKDDSFSGKQLN